MEARRGAHEESDVGQREWSDIGVERRRRRDVDQRSWGAGGRIERRLVYRCELGRVAGEADVVLDDPLERRDRLEADERVTGGGLERRVELARQLPVGHHGHVILQLAGGIRRGCSRALGGARWQLDRANEGVELPEGSAGEVVEIIALTRRWLIVADIRIVTDVEEGSRGVEDGERQIAAKTVGVVDVEDGGPGRRTAGKPGYLLDLLIVEGELIPIDIGCRTEFPGHADRVAVRLEQVADILGSAERVVGLRRFARLSREKRVSRQAEDVDAHRGETDIGIPDD